MLGIIFASLIVSSVVTAEPVGYTAVEGTCDGLKPVPNYDQRRYIEGLWLKTEANYVKEGDKCGSVKMTDQGDNKLGVIVHVYSTTSKAYYNIANDLVHKGDGTYTGDNNAFGIVLDTDYDNYHVYIQCVKDDSGKTSVVLTYATRSGKEDEAAKSKFAEIRETLKSKKLYAAMQSISQDDCPAS